MNIGDRVLVTGGAWQGYSGEYCGIYLHNSGGDLHKVCLDNGMTTPVPMHHILPAPHPPQKTNTPPKPKNATTKPGRSKKIRCQVRMIDVGQVDVEVEEDVLPAQLIKVIEAKAELEFGEYDRMEVEEIEEIL